MPDYRRLIPIRAMAWFKNFPERRRASCDKLTVILPNSYQRSQRVIEQTAPGQTLEKNSAVMPSVSIFHRTMTRFQWNVQRKFVS
jgi:hypothetical protein